MELPHLLSSTATPEHQEITELRFREENTKLTFAKRDFATSFGRTSHMVLVRALTRTHLG